MNDAPTLEHCRSRGSDHAAYNWGPRLDWCMTTEEHFRAYYLGYYENPTVGRSALKGEMLQKKVNAEARAEVLRRVYYQWKWQHCD